MNLRMNFRNVAPDFRKLSLLMNKYLLTLLVTLFCSVILFAQTNLRTGNVLDTHSLIISEGIGPTISRTDYSNIGLGYNIKAGVEYFLTDYNQHYFGLKLSGNLGEISASDPNRIPETHITSLYSLNFGLLYSFQLDHYLYPFFSIGLTVTYFDPRDASKNKLPGNTNNLYENYSSDYFLEAGLKYRLSSNFLLFAEGTLYIDEDDLLDDYSNSDMADFYGTITFGLSYAITFKSDSDNDGVTDNWDKCPFTPSNVEVDEFGCPVDNDLDGIPDYRDTCLDTPIGIEVDRFGCALDIDKDDIPDYRDECPDTPAGVQVDSAGCPVDSDQDGVPDYLDLCPETEPGAEVDSSGCYKIDRSGNYFESTIIYFDSGESFIDEIFYNKLDKLVYFINNYNDVVWYIEGHSDNLERSDSGESISMSRAKAVLDYLVRRGVSINKLKITDKGSSFAVEDNNTTTGRSKNRRVVIFGIK